MNHNSLLWARRAIGKIVVAPGGPIAQGAQYQTTGRSVAPAFPDLGDAVSFSSFGITDHEDWENYLKVWPTGGLYLRPAASGSSAYLLASHVRPYLERLSSRSRYFVETLHATTPVEQLEPSSLFQLFQELRAEPLTAPDPQLSPLCLERSKTIDLPVDWFFQCRPMIEAIASGTVLVTKDIADTPIKFFERALWAYSCFPASLRWRIPIAAGLYSNPLSSAPSFKVGLALGYSCQSSSPRINSIGTSFVNWIEAVTNSGKNCKTIQDLLDIVAAKFPQLTKWNDMPPEIDLGPCLRSTLGEIRHVEQAKSWLQLGAKAPATFDNLVHLRQEVINLLPEIIDSSSRKKKAFIGKISASSWKEQWRTLLDQSKTHPKELTAIAKLLGFAPLNGPDDLVQVVRDIELPNETHPSVADRLGRALEKSRIEGELHRWAPMLELALVEEAPDWLQYWRQANASRISWAIIELFVRNEIDVTCSWQLNESDTHYYQLKSVLHERRIQSEEFIDLIVKHAAHEDPEVTLGLIQLCEEVNPLLSIRLAAISSNQDWIDQKLSPTAFSSIGSHWIAAIVSLCNSQEAIDRNLAECLLAVWERLDKEQRLTIRTPLRSAIGEIESLLFEGVIPPPSALTESWVWEKLREICERDQKQLRAILVAVSNAPEFVGREFKEKLLVPLLFNIDESSIPSSCLSLRYAYEVKSGKALKSKEFSERELECASIWSTMLTEPHPSQLPLKLFRVSQFPIAVLYRKGLPNSQLVPQLGFWQEWISLTLANPCKREKLQKYVAEAKLDDAPGWRLIFGWNGIGRLTDEELEIIGSKELLQRFVSDVVRIDDISDETLSSLFDRLRVSDEVLERVCVSCRKARQFYVRCSRLIDESDILRLWVHILDKVYHDRSIAGLRRYLKPGMFTKFQISVYKFMGKKGYGTGWVSLLAEIYDNSTSILKRQMLDELNRC